tara:strand:+ start:3715 stop:4539 length:825 start_codon:yes stop_codon:yes gene_type:complete
MKISISSRITEQSDNKEKSFISLDSFVKLASKNKFDGVSLRPSMISTQSSKYLVNQAKKLFKVNNMKVSMITSNIHLAKNDELASDILRNITPSLDLAETLKTSLIRIMIKNRDDIFYAKKALDEAKERNLKLLQQTHWGTLAETLDETVKLIKTINRQNFGITFEPANLMACGSDFNKNALNQLLPYTENFYFQNIILDKKGKHVFPTIHNGDVSVKYVSLDNSNGINVFSFLDFLREKKYDKWFTVHQPLLEDQTVKNAIENASKLFLEYKF